VYHQKLQQQQQQQQQQQSQQYQQYQQRQLQLQQEQRYRQEQERLLYGTSPKLSPSSHAARDYDIKRKLSAKQRERRDDNNNKPKSPQHQHQQQQQQSSSLTGSPGTVKQRVKERKHTMKDAEVIAKLRTICTESDPSLVYKNMRKIGQG
jgi:p21-activated kinase 1